MSQSSQSSQLSQSSDSSDDNNEEIIQDKTIQVNDEITEETIEKKKRSEKEQEDPVLRKKFELEMINVLSSSKHKASFEADESVYIRKYALTKKQIVYLIECK